MRAYSVMRREEFRKKFGWMAVVAMCLAGAGIVLLARNMRRGGHPGLVAMDVGIVIVNALTFAFACYQWHVNREDDR